MKITRKNIIELLKNELGTESIESMEKKELDKLVRAKKKEIELEAQKDLEGQIQVTVEEKEENKGFNLDEIVAVPIDKKKAVSFNQNKSISIKLGELATKNNKKPNQALNLILENIIDLEAGKCKIEIDEIQEEKIQTTFRIDTKYANILESEAKSRNMSFSEYLNKVLGIMFK